MLQIWYDVFPCVCADNWCCHHTFLRLFACIRKFLSYETCPIEVRLSSALQVDAPALVEVVEETSHSAPSTFSFLINYPVENGAQNKTTVAMGVFIPTTLKLLASVCPGR